MNSIGWVRLPTLEQLANQGAHNPGRSRVSVVVRALASAILLVLPMMLVGSFAGSAYAQPDDAAQPDDLGNPTGITLPWRALGLPSSVDLYRDGTSTYTVALPAGLTAARLQGMIHTPVDMAAGFVEINDGEGNFLASVEMPPAAPGVVVAPFDVDIAAAPVRNSSVELSFTLRERDARVDRERVCELPARLELSNLATVFAGEQLPVTTVANFFAPVLGKLTIYAPIDASSAEQEAVLTLASAVARFYAARSLPIEVVGQERGAVPPPASGLDRAVVVETGEPGLTVVNAGAPNAYLRVSGDGDDLSKQVSLVATQLQPLAQVSTARVDQAGSDAALSGDTLTFKQLGVGGERTDILGTSNLQIGIQRARLGPRFDDVEVHLLADYTPVPAHDAASVVIRSDKLVVYRAALNDSGHLDATFNLDASELSQQWVNLEFALTYTPDQPCGSVLAPITFQVDPRSTLTMHRGGPPLGGFAAFPSEFSPKFLVALDGSSPNQLSYAARVVAAVARLNKAEITPQIVDVQTAADATSGALIVANSEAISQTPLTPPVSSNGSSVNFALPTELQVNIDSGLGSIQAFADPPHNRSVVLVTTTADWSLVDPLFSYFDGSDRDWSGLTGDVLAAGAAGTPVNIAIRTAGDASESPQSSASVPWLKAPQVVVGVLAAIAAIAAVAIVGVILYLRKRRPRTTPDPIGANTSADPH